MGLADEVIYRAYPEAVQSQPLHPDDASYAVERLWFQARDVLPSVDPVNGEITPAHFSPPHSLPPSPPRAPSTFRMEDFLDYDDILPLYEDDSGYYAVEIDGVTVFLD